MLRRQDHIPGEGNRFRRCGEEVIGKGEVGDGRRKLGPQRPIPHTLALPPCLPPTSVPSRHPLVLSVYRMAHSRHFL